ncbi:MAG TPA: 5-dehydro-4-deoxy-D-glucuronate isomerase [Spirochaetia bacterium]|nr:5-dehydro-4-deoxy-D-glucuronate isomerase [Spirochaetia bacterium]
MEIRYSIGLEEAKGFDTEKLRKEFLIDDLFIRGTARLVYSHTDRIIVCGIMPGDSSISLEAGKELGAATFLERREMGLINVGGEGTVSAEGKKYELKARDGLYIGQGSKGISFASASPQAPAKFYALSAPAHAAHPTMKVSMDEAKQLHLGSKKESNARTIYQYIHPDVLKTCQLVMGMTVLEPENVWNTMPTHTHERRMEVYFYFDLPEDAVVFHLMGQPRETRHLVMRNEQAAISPSWSIHSGVGTISYTFIWGMVGENQTFDDMDWVSMKEIQ